jgi:L-iditol 2-dehydrogenase
VILAARIQEDYSLDVSTMERPPLPPRGAHVRVLGCGVCGSDLDKLMHRKAKPGQVLGHEVVGIIETLAEGHPEGWRVGDRIVSSHHVPCLQCHYCLNDSESMCRQFKSTNFTPGGFSQVIALSEGHLKHTAFKVPDFLTDAEASCVEPLACVLRAVRRGGRHKNATVVIVGLGFIGMMAAQVYQQQGATVFGLDLDRERLALAERHQMLNGAFHPVEDAGALHAALLEKTPLGQADIVFLTAVNSKTVQQALSLLRDGGNLVVFTSASPDTVIDPSQLYFREINLITSYSPALADLRHAADLVFSRKINLLPLVSHTLPLAEIRQAIELYRSGKAIKVFVQSGETK